MALSEPMLVNTPETVALLQEELAQLAAQDRLFLVNGMHAFCSSGERLKIEDRNPGAQFYLGEEIKRSTSRFSRAFEKEGVISAASTNNGFIGLIAGSYHDNKMYIGAAADYGRDAGDPLASLLSRYQLKGGGVWVPFSNRETPDLDGERLDSFVRAAFFGMDYQELEARAARMGDVIAYWRSKQADPTLRAAPHADEMAHTA